jgi:hypothetical protein
LRFSSPLQSNYSTVFVISVILVILFVVFPLYLILFVIFLLRLGALFEGREVLNRLVVQQMKDVWIVFLSIVDDLSFS